MSANLVQGWRRFASAVIKHWFFSLGGVTVAVLTYIWGQVRHLFQPEGPDIPPSVFYAGALLLMLVACFLAWRDEHEARLKAEGERDEYTQGTKRPLLRPFMDAIIQGLTADNRLSVAIILNIGNDGLPAIAQRWRTKVHGARGARELNNTHLEGHPTLLRCLNRKKEVRLDEQSDLLTKSLAHISNGGSCRGALYFYDLDCPLQIGEVLEITFEDGYRNPYTLKEKITKDHFNLTKYANLEMVIVDTDALGGF